MPAISIEQRIKKFRSDLKTLGAIDIVKKHVTFGDCYIFEDNDKYYSLKSEIARRFNIHPNEVLVVGSGKLGFSIAPDKRYKHFNDQSDIDVAIVSPTLFDKIWGQVFEYQDQVSYDWQIDDQRAFEHYLFTGWIRPDKLPPASSFIIRKEWWDFFQNLTGTGDYGPYMIYAGLYKSWLHLERYQCKCVKQCADGL